MSDDFHTVSHESVDGTGDNWQKHFNVRKWQAEQMARLAQGLADIPEGDGTAFDNTCIVWMSELGYETPLTDPTRNAHMRGGVNGQTATALIGNCSGFFDSGKVVDAGARNYCDLLLTLVHAMGYTDVQSVGSSSSGPLSAIIRS